ncbi:MAG TPA: YvcK family protein [Firmicutes bacterium]|nr:YvcK family protein [Candidatus Fermentithermobacillaceae bacterium]
MNRPEKLKIVAIGGGTGLASVLRGLKSLDCDITAIVTVADDGGSSGRLRKDMKMLPPGDIRNCLVALAEAEPDMTSLFNHRFARGALAGHNFGNLFLAAMTEMTGDFQLAVRTMSRILAVKGRVLPATLSDVTLRAEMDDGSIVFGEYAIPQVRKRIVRLSLMPPDPPALDEAVRAIGEADGIIIGPGSLYTSVIPNLLVPGIRDAIASSRARKLYVCNIMTQPGETDGYSVSDHVFAIERHAGRLFAAVLANTAEAPEGTAAKYAGEDRFQVRLDRACLVEKGYSVVAGDYLSRGDLARHDSSKLAVSIMQFVGDSGASNIRRRKVASGS